MPSFRAGAWDPWLTIAQICCLQAVFYVTLTIVMAAFSLLTGTALSLDQILSDLHVRFDTASGWLMVFGYWIAAAASARALVWIVERAKLCLDFGGTLYLLHLIFCTQYDAFPKSASWWLVTIAALLGTSILGEYWCMKRELEPIALAGGLGGRRISGGRRESQAEDVAMQSLVMK